MKGKTKQQKGITLIALIITIVVLLILAAVAISSIQNDGILHYAQNAADNWNKAAQNEANMLGDYMNYLNNMGSSSTSGTWTQNGTTVTNGKDTLAVGDTVKVQVGEGTAEAYSANGYSNWKVLGAENGQLLLVTAENVGDNLYLEGKEGYNTGIAQLTDRCDDYLNSTYATEARSIKVEDLNRITGFIPSSYSGYGESYTYTSDFVHPTKGEASSSNPITEERTYYYYDTSSDEIGNVAYNLLFGGRYWLASSYVEAYSSYAEFGLRCVYGGDVDYCFLWDSYDGASYDGEGGVRAVVSLKSNVTVTKV